MTPSRDPIRDHFREQERQRRQRIVMWSVMILGAVLFWVMVALALVVLG